MVDVGAFGRCSDGGTLSASPFGRALREHTLDLPEDTTLPDAEDLGPVPHVFVGDEAFPLRRDLMRPYPGRQLSREQRVFNYRLSRARRIVENAFGILAAQWRMYRRVISLRPENVEHAVKATVILHNFLRWDSPDTFPATSAGDASQALQTIPRAGSNNPAQEAMAVRQTYTQFFSSPAGEVSWQNHVL